MSGEPKQTFIVERRSAACEPMLSMRGIRVPAMPIAPFKPDYLRALAIRYSFYDVLSNPFATDVTVRANPAGSRDSAPEVQHARREFLLMRDYAERDSRLQT